MKCPIKRVMRQRYIFGAPDTHTRKLAPFLMVVTVWFFLFWNSRSWEILRLFWFWIWNHWIPPQSPSRFQYLSVLLCLSLCVCLSLALFFYQNHGLNRQRRWPNINLSPSRLAKVEDNCWARRSWQCQLFLIQILPDRCDFYMMLSNYVG